MTLVSAKCTNCGAILQVNKAQDAAICQHCGSAFIVEKAINNFHVTNHISADTVHIHSSPAEFEIRAGVLEKYHGSSTEVTIPSGVQIIGHHAFTDCYGLTSVVIPEGVTTLLYGSFKDCSQLRKVHLPSTIRTLDSPFYRCSSLEELDIPSGIHHLCLNYTTGLRKVTLHEGISHLPRWAFSNCPNLQEIILPASITEVEAEAFQCCSSLRKLTVLGTNTKFHQGDSDTIPFFHCSNLIDITSPHKKVIEKQEDAFNGSAWYYRRHKRCSCGGYFKGLLKPICTRCRKPKDY